MEQQVNYDNIGNAQTEAVPLIDPMTGKKTVIRHFFFKRNPLMRSATKQEIVSQFKRLIEYSLYSDGLIVCEEQPIEVIERKKAKRTSKHLYQKMISEGADFVILVLAQPRLNTFINEKALKL